MNNPPAPMRSRAISRAGRSRGSLISRSAGSFRIHVSSSRTDLSERVARAPTTSVCSQFGDPLTYFPRACES